MVTDGIQGQIAVFNGQPDLPGTLPTAQKFNKLMKEGSTYGFQAAS